MVRRKMIRALAALVALVPFAACDDGSPGIGQLTVLLTDAPGDFHAAVVTISEVYLQGSNDEGDRVVLMDEPITTDLLTLSNDVATMVENVAVPEGRYSQLRFVIPGAYIEVEGEDGETSIYASSPDYAGLPSGAVVDGSLQMPSYDQTGLKVNLPGGTVRVEGDQNILLVDFDVQQSFGKLAGHSGMWVMTPLIHAVDFQLSVDVLASLELGDDVELPVLGEEQVSLADFRARLTNDAESVTELALEDRGDGVFEARFQYLVREKGPFTVEFVGPEGVSFEIEPEGAASVSPQSGGTAEVRRTITSAGLAG